METTSTPVLRSALILKADRLASETLRLALHKLAPGVQVVTTHTVRQAYDALARSRFDLIVTGLDASLEGDALQLIADHMNGLPVFVVGTQLEYRTLVVLQSLPIRGVFDASTEGPEAFHSALRAVICGQRYWSKAVQDRVDRELTAAQSICQHLSNTEQLVLSVLGDGSDDSTAAQALGVSPATISTFRRKLHRKLRVQHRGELMRVAAINGFVRFTPSGVVRPGFAMLAAECLARKRKRRAAAEAAVTAFMLENTPEQHLLRPAALPLKSA
ncbi:LuxR C-terminal-related transcriptional regulator [Opitutus sp. ER46]|uniref:helix-turn-helix transcriptional regulator n=1 Tax=Opitutus sp. ER46 TaxID=2161864 RepID=UPI000D3029C0|nr:LuxR C-terminal-related transcriptional regulator [Opitutus sp. ER46]PTX91694.1 hypothetical protein DB354_17670 [Opitutus sp. ER46]